MNNEWRILKHPYVADIYKISSYGNIKDIYTNETLETPLLSNGGLYCKLESSELYKKQYGHYTITLPVDDLMGIAFLNCTPNRVLKCVIAIRHKDGDLKNIFLDNLEWYNPVEQWHPIIHDTIISDMYEISSFGRIRKTNTNTILSIVYACNGKYPSYNLKRVDGKYGLFSAKILIASEFVVGRKNPYDRVRNINGIDRDICIKNLEWYTPYDDNECYSDEVWKDVIYPDVKRDMYIVSSYGRIKNKYSGQPIKPMMSTSGYNQVKLMGYDGTSHNRQVHRIVCTAFHPNPLNLPQVNHIDGNKTHNHYLNLEWVTPLENITHAIKTGLTPKGCDKNNLYGDQHPSTKVTDNIVEKVCHLLIQYYGNIEWVYRELKPSCDELTLKIILHIKEKSSRQAISDKYFTKEQMKQLKYDKINLVKESFITNEGNVRAVYNDLIDKLPYLTLSWLEQFKYSGKYFPKKYFKDQRFK